MKYCTSCPSKGIGCVKISKIQLISLTSTKCADTGCNKELGGCTSVYKCTNKECGAHFCDNHMPGHLVGGEFTPISKPLHDFNYSPP